MSFPKIKVYSDLENKKAIIDAEYIQHFPAVIHEIGEQYNNIYDDTLFVHYDNNVGRSEEDISKVVCYDVGSYFDTANQLLPKIREIIEVFETQHIDEWKYRVGTITNNDGTDIVFCMIVQFPSKMTALKAKLSSQNSLSIQNVKNDEFEELE